MQTQLLEIEPEYKANLLNAVEVYKETMVTFVGDYDDKYADDYFMYQKLLDLQNMVFRCEFSSLNSCVN